MSTNEGRGARAAGCGAGLLQAAKAVCVEVSVRVMLPPKSVGIHVENNQGFKRDVAARPPRRPSLLLAVGKCSFQPHTMCVGCCLKLGARLHVCFDL
jgi:hypothetical protein